MARLVLGIVAAFCFVLGVIVPDGQTKSVWTFWLLLGLAAIALAYALTGWEDRNARR